MRLLLIILPLFLSFFAFSEEYILFISTEKEGVVISAVPATDQYVPTTSELQRYKVYVVDLTASEVSQLLAQNINTSLIVTSERKLKIKMNKLKDKKQKAKIKKGDLEYEDATASTIIGS